MERLSEKDYLADFRAYQTRYSKNQAADASRRSSGASKAWFCDRNQQKPLLLSDIPAIQSADVEVPTVILVENINLDWISKLGTTYKIDVAFFCVYLSGFRDCSPWSAIFGDNTIPQLKPERLDHDFTESYHIHGVVQLGLSDKKRENPRLQPSTNLINRRIEYHAPFGWEANVRMSYCRLDRNLYLFLVDPGIDTGTVHNTPMSMETLHFPVSFSRGGLVLPPLFSEEQHSLAATLLQFFSHGWHLHTMIHQNLSPGAILYLLVASTWLANLRFIDQKLKDVAFRDIREPDVKTNNQLHDFRESLAVFQDKVSYAKKWMPPNIRTELEQALGRDGYVDSPDSTFGTILAEVDNSGRFLMDTFQLLLSSISVRDSEASIRQARSGQKLTQLATIFVPLSFVTGVFGMNIKEINDSPLSSWVCVIAAVVVTLFTIGILGLLDRWQSRRDDKRRS